MNINLEYYKIFYNVAKLKSITLAANALFISQPAVSQSIKALEIALGSTLFIRTPKGVRLTPEGEMLFSYVATGYENIKLGEDKLKKMLDLECGEVHIGASDMTLQFYLLPHLEAFHKLYPKIKVSVTNAPTPDTIDFLNAGKIDFGVVSSPLAQKYKLSIIPVCEIEDIFVAGSRFDYLRNQVIELNELEKMPIICLEENTSTRRYINEFLKSNGVTLYPEFELATSDLIVQFVARNLGVGCVVKNFAERYIKEGDLFEIKLQEKIPSRNICIVTGDKSQISAAGKKLLDILI
jgi:DNA-binding transcriptional LysR family regulator